MIEIIEVKTKKDQKNFVNFPNKLYKNNKYFCPALTVDELNLFNPAKNVSYEESPTDSGLLKNINFYFAVYQK